MTIRRRWLGTTVIHFQVPWWDFVDRCTTWFRQLWYYVAESSGDREPDYSHRMMDFRFRLVRVNIYITFTSFSLIWTFDVVFFSIIFTDFDRNKVFKCKWRIIEEDIAEKSCKWRYKHQIRHTCSPSDNNQMCPIDQLKIQDGGHLSIWPPN